MVRWLSNKLIPHSAFHEISQLQHQTRHAARIVKQPEQQSGRGVPWNWHSQASEKRVPKTAVLVCRMRQASDYQANLLEHSACEPPLVCTALCRCTSSWTMRQTPEMTYSRLRLRPIDPSAWMTHLPFLWHLEVLLLDGSSTRPVGSVIKGCRLIGDQGLQADRWPRAAGW